MKTIAVIQARMGSSRLPGKVMADLGERKLINWVIDRVRTARRVDGIILAISDHPENDDFAAYVAGLGETVYRGSEDDVLTRFHGAAKAVGADIVVRITADCPFIDPELIDAVIALRTDVDADYAANTIQRWWPDGLDVEVMTFSALEEASAKAQGAYLRQHVTPFIHGQVPAGLSGGNFKTVHLVGTANFSHLRWTIDEAQDLEFARRVAASLPPDFHWQDLVALLTQQPELLRINSHIELNAGARRDFVAAGGGRRYDRSNQFFARACQSIPLASQTFSKSYQQWPRGVAPLFVERGAGCRVWDIDGNDYIDYVLGLLPVVLGYCDPDVDAAITAQLAKGIVFPLASPLESEVAERLIQHIPCAEQVRFGKNGSDATTAAVRLARAFTGRKKILVGGYHGWHDWYIGSTTRDLGVPAAIKALTSAFAYNDANAIEKALQSDPDGYAAVILEPAGAASPAPGFLERVRALTEQYGVVLIFDEIITGFRISMGGAQQHYGVTPDLACFGKAIANGMPLAAIVGRADIMGLMNEVFVSTTFGGEALSLAAAAACMDKLVREDVPARLWSLGGRLRAGLAEASARHGFAGILETTGMDWWPLLKISDPPVGAPLFTSLLRQEFIRNGLLLAGTFNMSLAHDVPHIERATLQALDKAFSSLRQHLDSPDPEGCLQGDLIQPTFRVR